MENTLGYIKTSDNSKSHNIALLKSVAAVLRQVSPIMINDNFEELKELVEKTHNYNTNEDTARNTWGLCYIVGEISNNYSDGIFFEVLKDMYGLGSNPFGQFGFSYYDDRIDWVFRGEKALEIADYIDQVIDHLKKG